MTEFEQQLIEKLTKQLEVKNKLDLKKMQNDSLWEDKMTTAEIEHLKEKARFYKNAGDLLAIFSTAIVIIAILIIILLTTGLGACASIF